MPIPKKNSPSNSPLTSSGSPNKLVPIEWGEKRKLTQGNLSISPSSVQFKNIEPGVYYEATVVIQNLASQPKNIRLTIGSSNSNNSNNNNSNNNSNGITGLLSFKNSPGSSMEIAAPYGLDKKVITVNNWISRIFESNEVIRNIR